MFIRLDKWFNWNIILTVLIQYPRKKYIYLKIILKSKKKKKINKIKFLNYPKILTLLKFIHKFSKKS